MNGGQPIPEFNCTLEKGNLSLEISAKFNTVTSRQYFIGNERAIKAAQMSATQMMKNGWRLVMLNGQKVKQGKVIIPTSSLVTEIKNAPHPNFRLPLGGRTENGS